MKIVCDNCSAKYSIADEKVAGKVFKIRCKKCTNVIVVRGDQIAAEVSAEPSRASGYDYGGDAVWHVVVDGDQQGPFDPAKLGEMLSAGTIDWEAYVWREGFEGWKPAKDVPELVTTLGGSPASEGGADPFAGSAGGASAFAGGADAGADLFAPSAGTALGAGAASGDDDVVASPSPSPRAAAPASSDANMTGQRNENSVLFSLSNLQALATGEEEGAAASPEAPAPSGPIAGAAAGEGSGLIDIRALASATSATAASSGAGDGGGAAADLLSIGGGGGGVTSGLGGPVLAPAQAEPEKSNKGMAIGLAVVAVLVLGLLGVVIKMMMDDKPQAVATREIVRVVEKAAPATANPAAPEAAAMAVGTADEEPEANMDGTMSSTRMRASTAGMTSSGAMSDTTDPVLMTVQHSFRRAQA
ncbi:MAG: GYF domain-containing protein, partial [Myxococcota bacterium]